MPRTKAKTKNAAFTKSKLTPLDRLTPTEHTHLLSLIKLKTKLPTPQALHFLSTYTSFATTYRYWKIIRILHTGQAKHERMSEADQLFHMWQVPTIYESLVDQVILEFEKETREFTKGERRVLLAFVLRERVGMKERAIRIVVEEDWTKGGDIRRVLGKFKVRTRG